MIDIKGKGSVGIAIAYYSLRGMVSIPLEPCEYNLILDIKGNIHRIKVISCSYKTKYGIYSASIRTMSSNTYKKFNYETCEYVFVVTSDLDMYNIPSSVIDAKRQISLSVYNEYKVTMNDIPG